MFVGPHLSLYQFVIPETNLSQSYHRKFIPMYIPQVHSPQPEQPRSSQLSQCILYPRHAIVHRCWSVADTKNGLSTALRNAATKASKLSVPVFSRSTVLWKRTTSQDLDTTIGIVVGVLLGVFLIASVAFLYIYRGSIRMKRRRRHRHRHHKSTSSKSSKLSDGGGSAAAAPPPTPPAE